MKVSDRIEAPSMYDDGDVIRLSSFEVDTPRIFRILGTMIPFSATWYQASTMDSQTGEAMQQPRMIRRPINFAMYDWKAEPCIFDRLEAIDRDIRRRSRAVGPGQSDKVASVWASRPMFAFAVIDRAMEEPAICVLEVGYSIFKQIKALQAKLDPENPAMLLHGPIWVGDVVITKTEKGNRKGKSYQNIAYTVESLRTNKYAGRIPVAYMGSDDAAKKKRAALFSDAVKRGIFTSKEKSLIEKYDEQAFIERYKPMSPDEIMEIVTASPIALDAVDMDGNPIFSRPELYMKAFAAAELNGPEIAGYLESGEQVGITDEEPSEEELEEEETPEEELEEELEEETPEEETPEEETPEEELEEETPEEETPEEETPEEELEEEETPEEELEEELEEETPEEETPEESADDDQDPDAITDDDLSFLEEDDSDVPTKQPPVKAKPKATKPVAKPPVKAKPKATKPVAKPPVKAKPKATKPVAKPPVKTRRR
jgi:hypothetical protein